MQYAIRDILLCDIAYRIISIYTVQEDFTKNMLFSGYARKDSVMPLPKSNQPKPPRTAKERIYQTLLEWIIDGTLAPEEKLNDSEISKFFHVSRTPVREAMQLLADQHLIEVYPGRESIVSPIKQQDTGEIYHMLAELHVLALQFSFPSIDDAVISELQTLNRKLTEACANSDVKTIRLYDSRFHGIFVNLSKNPFLKRFIETLESHVARIENLYYNADTGKSRSPKQHEELITALKKRDLETACSIVRDNWISALNYCI